MKTYLNGDGAFYYLKGNLWFHVMAMFSDDNAVRNSNEYMENNEGASVLAVEFGVVIIAHKDDSGTTIQPMGV